MGYQVLQYVKCLTLHIHLSYKVMLLRLHNKTYKNSEAISTCPKMLKPGNIDPVERAPFLGSTHLRNVYAPNKNM